MSRILAALAALCLLPAALAAEPAAEAWPKPVDHTALHKAIAAADADLVVVNAWATWCVPCVEEFPHFVKLRNAYRERGVEVYFVSGDFIDNIGATRKFLQKQKVDWPSFIKDGPDAPFIESLHKEWTGTLPATFIFDSDGKLLTWWAKPVDYDELENEVKALLDKQG